MNCLTGFSQLNVIYFERIMFVYGFPLQKNTVKGFIFDHFRLMELTATLSPHCLKLETKRIYCLVLMGITYDLMKEEDLVHSLLDTLIGYLQSCVNLIENVLSAAVHSVLLLQLIVC